MAVLLGNRLEYPEIAAGLAKAGLVMVPLNPRLTPPRPATSSTTRASRPRPRRRARAVVGDAVADDRLVTLSLDGTQLGPSYDDALAAASAADPW